MSFDSEKLTIAELRERIKRDNERIAELQEAGRNDLIERLTREAETLGYDSLETLFDRPRRTKRGRPNGAATRAD